MIVDIFQKKLLILLWKLRSHNKIYLQILLVLLLWIQENQIPYKEIIWNICFNKMLNHRRLAFKCVIWTVFARTFIICEMFQKRSLKINIWKGTEIVKHQQSGIFVICKTAAGSTRSETIFNFIPFMHNIALIDNDK